MMNLQKSSGQKNGKGGKFRRKAAGQAIAEYVMIMTLIAIGLVGAFTALRDGTQGSVYRCLQAVMGRESKPPRALPAVTPPVPVLGTMGVRAKD